MKAVPFVDLDGFYVEDVMIIGEFTGVINRARVSEEMPGVMGYEVGYPLPSGLYKPRLDVERLKREYKSDDAQKWPDGSDVELAMSYWIEGLTAEEITKLHKPVALSEAEQIRHEMAEQNAVMWDFILSGGVS